MTILENQIQIIQLLTDFDKYSYFFKQKLQPVEGDDADAELFVCTVAATSKDLVDGGDHILYKADLPVIADSFLQH